MTGLDYPAARTFEPVAAYRALADLGFLAHSDLPDRPGPAYLLVAIRSIPTLHHYDPERIEFWVTDCDRGRRSELTRDSRLPIDRSFSWGVIRLIDRLGISNEYLTFGGDLRATMIDGTLVAEFRSPAPLLRRGGHSQGWDNGAETLGAFFGRVMLAVDYVDGFEARFAAVGPVARYALFLGDTLRRYRHSPTLRATHPELWTTIQAEERRLRTRQPEPWSQAEELKAAIEPILRAG